MTVWQLNRDQMDELKTNYVCELAKARGETPSWGEMADAPDIISDDEIYEIYADISFSPDDFAYSYTSAENGDYSPSNPWNAPGMSISDFI